MNGDGKMDIVVANNSSNTVSVLRNTATSGSITSGSLAAKVDFTTGTNPIAVSIVDVDGDGRPEIAAANFYSNTMSVLRNTSNSSTINSSSFAAKVDFTTATHPYGIAAGDIDGDGKMDYCCAPTRVLHRYLFSGIQQHLGAISSSSFAAKVDFATASNPYSIALGDIDGDGKLDVIAANNGANSISVFRNTATSGSITTGSLASKVDFTTGSAPYFVSPR